MSGSLRDLFRVPTGTNSPIDLSLVDPGPTPGVSRKKAEKQADSDRKRLARLQDRLSAERTRSLLLVLQGMDTAGKDGTVKHVIRAMNSGGVRVTPFKAPTDDERRHDFLWRITKALPAPGQVGVFNRSHYEDVVVVRVQSLAPEDVWRPRFSKINAYEKRLSARGIAIVKVFLQISRGEQKDRILKRLEDPTKRWKFNSEDLDHRERWDDYMAAYGEAIGRCSTEAAPWYVVPANSKWFRDWAIGRILIETLEEMNPEYPQPALDVETILTRLNRPSMPTSRTTLITPPAHEETIVVPDDARDLLLETPEGSEP